MKRGVVMEVKRKKAVILTENGRFETIHLPKRKEPPKIGDKVSMAGEGAGFSRKKHSPRWLPVISTVTVLMIFIVLLGGVFPSHPNKTVAAYVSYDVNPSFSAAVNGKLQVVSVKTWNKDAKRLFSDWDTYRFMSLKDFSHQIIQKIAQKGYFDGNQQVLIATTVMVPKSSKRKKVQNALQNAVDQIRSDDLLAKNDVVVSVESADPKTRKNANAHGLSVGRYMLYLDAENSDRSLSISKIKQMSVSAIKKKIKSDKLSDTSHKGDPALTMEETGTDEQTVHDNESSQTAVLVNEKNTPQSVKMGSGEHKKKAQPKKEPARPATDGSQPFKKLDEPKSGKEYRGGKGHYHKNPHHRKKGKPPGKSRPNPHQHHSDSVKPKHPGNSKHHKKPKTHKPKGHKQHEHPKHNQNKHQHSEHSGRSDNPGHSKHHHHHLLKRLKNVPILDKIFN